MHKTKWLISLLLFGSVPMALIVLMLTRIAEPRVAGITARALAWASGGGILTGVAVKRFLARPRYGSGLILGLALATVPGVLTVGGLYLVLLSHPLAPIGTPERTIEQMMGFLQFLLAEAAGIILTPAPPPSQA